MSLSHATRPISLPGGRTSVVNIGGAEPSHGRVGVTIVGTAGRPADSARQ